MAKRCYYEVLGVEKNADEQTIKVAHRKLAMQYHPDRNPGDGEAEIRFKEVSEAYEVLRDPKKKARYDRYGHAGLEDAGGGFADGAAGGIFEFINEVFGGRGGRGGPRGGADVQVAFEISLIEAYRGTRKEFKLPRRVHCDQCSGSGMTAKSQRAACRRCGGQGVIGGFLMAQHCPQCRGRGYTLTDPCGKCRGGGIVETEQDVAVEVPAGIDDGMSIRMTGYGEAGEAGAPPGDLYCLVRVKSHPLFARDGVHLHCEVPITFSQAALGGPLEVPTLEGKSASAKVPRGSQTGDELRLQGKGMPHVRGGRPGDLVVHLRVVTPRNLTTRQEELLRELAEIEGTNPTAEGKSWMEGVFSFFTSLGKFDDPAPKDKKP